MPECRDSMILNTYWLGAVVAVAVASTASRFAVVVVVVLADAAPQSLRQ